jgi:hypothetical protein
LGEEKYLEIKLVVIFCCWFMIKKGKDFENKVVAPP